MITTELISQQQDKRKLPNGWRWVKLVEIAEQGNKYAIVDGPFGSSIKQSDYLNSGIPLIRIKNISREGNFINHDFLYISEEKYREQIRSAIKKDDILVSRVGTVGNICIYPGTFEKALLSTTGVCKVSLDKQIADVKYIYFFMLSEDYKKQLISGVSESVQKYITLDTLKKSELPLPPLPEQKRIVAILNEQMEAVERARQATLAQLKAAIALPAAYLRAVFNSPEAQQWERQRLGNVLQLRKEVVHPRDNPRGLATFVGLEHIESLTGVRTGSIDVEMSQLTGRKPRFYKGDIVYGYLRPYLNKVWIADFDGLCSIDQYVYSVKTDIAETKFVAWFMRSSVYLKRAPINKTPGQLPRIRTDEVASVEINLPSLEEQQRIAANLTKQLAEVKHIQKSLESQLDAINKLPATLLRRAFNGEL